MRSKQEIETLLDLIKGRPRDTDELKGQEFALEWVLGLKGPKSAMCEANSNAVLAEVRADVELALKLSRYVHDNCKDVPHDIGLKLVEIISEHFS